MAGDVRVVHPLFPGIQKAWDEAVPFQVEDAHFVAAHRRTVLGHKTGLGKTLMAILAWSLWPEATKGLVVGTRSSTAVWYKLLQYWGGCEATILQGYTDPEWPKACEADQGVWLCTYATLRGLMKNTKGRPKFNVLINDELHRMMRSRKTEIYKAMCRVELENYVGCSATWASRGPQDLFPVLHLVNRNTFPSYWRFVETWCFVEKTNFGLEIFGVRNTDNLRTLLRSRYFVSRLYKDVVSQFKGAGEATDSPVIRRQQIIPMTEIQAKLYRELDEDMMTEYEGTTVVTPGSLSKLTRLLQIALAPRTLFPKADIGGGIEWLCDQVIEEPHTVIFAPFKATLDQISSALIADGTPPEKIFRLDGNIDIKDIDPTIDAWKEAQGVMLCTIDFAQSFDLDTTNTAYALGFDWDPNDNLQMEGRLRRLNSKLKSPCIVTYIVMEGTAYEEVKEVVNGKLYTVAQFLFERSRGNEPEPRTNTYDLDGSDYQRVL